MNCYDIGHVAQPPFDSPGRYTSSTLFAPKHQIEDSLVQFYFISREASVEHNYETVMLPQCLSDENQKEPFTLMVFTLCHLIFPQCVSKEVGFDSEGRGVSKQS